jgi:hypothetical protein
VQPVPVAAACAVPPERGIAQERDWLRRNLSAQYNAAAGNVSRVISKAPGLRGESREATDDAVTDLVAVGFYLSGEGRRLDHAVRTAAVGPHVPLARCVAAGLRRLPSYRGAAVLHASLTDAERDWYREDEPVTEWAFCEALTTAYPEPAGNTRFLIWSMTARRTHLLEPEAADRVFFLPGTRFKVLRVHPGERHTVLLREMSASETDDGGQAEAGRVPLDDIALAGLERVEQNWDQLTEGTPPPPPYALIPGNPPGLITTITAPVPAHGVGASTPREGTRP